MARISLRESSHEVEKAKKTTERERSFASVALALDSMKNEHLSTLMTLLENNEQLLLGAMHAWRIRKNATVKK